MLEKRGNVNKVVYELGKLPEITQGGRVIYETGNVVLRRGRHRGVNNGFGVEHILAEHSKELEQLNYTSDQQGVIDYVSAIFSVGAEIFCDYYTRKNGYRPLILKRSQGLLILEAMENKQGLRFYSVVTAYRTQQVKGNKVGKLSIK